MRYLYFIIVFLLCLNTIEAQIVEDDFEGSGTITSWYGDNCGINTSFSNPYSQSMNTSSTVLEYSDIGGPYANVQFDVATNFDLTAKNSFSIKVFLPSSGLTGSQTNQISLKLQDKNLAQPWTTQSEIIKPLVLNTWQEVTFDFENDTFINLDGNSLPPLQRTDFNRVVIQLNGENNNDHVLAYLDDVLYFDSINNAPVFDNLVWSDEFDGSGAIDGSKWFHQTQLPAGGSWYNGEIQHYTNRIDNTFESNGVLNLIAKKEVFTDQGQTKQYTSARLNSKFAFKYGKVEVRAKLPFGVGTWPAIWMLGKNITETGAYWQTQGFGTISWPACGEIDIMEHWGNNQNYVQSAMHTPSSFGGTVNHGGQTVSTASTQFHVYALQWTQEKMVFSVDGVEHYTYNPAIKDANTWPFDTEQYLLLNIAIQSSIDTNFTQSAMEIDYVRVYQENLLSTPELAEKIKTKAYPNPVDAMLNIAFDSEIENVTLQVFDISGRNINEELFARKSGSIQYNATALNAGVYFIKLLFENGKVNTLKFIKQ